MGDQKNLVLAIVTSVAIIVVFNIFFPQQTIVIPQQEKISNQESQTITSVDQVQETTEKKIQTREEIINNNKRIKISSKSLEGSINLKGGIIDDLILTQYWESQDEDSKNIQLLSPSGTQNPYYLEIGWKELSNNLNNINLPNSETLWATSSTLLSPLSPITLTWTNNQKITFNTHIAIDDDYMFSIDQEIINNSLEKISLYPYRFVKRINKPDTINFFILHEGLISIANEELLEKDYDDLSDDCSTNTKNKEEYCKGKSIGGWLGFTDKYWLTALIPNQKEEIIIDYWHNQNNNLNNFYAGYSGYSISINPNSTINYTGKLFAGAKVVKILNKYENDQNIVRFTDAVDWGLFSFLTKPIFYAINWFYHLEQVGNFGLAIIGFTILMRLILFPLAQASFKSMAKMKKLQPEMQRLKKIHGDDKQKMQRELMALYKKEGANPVAGCLPILLQIPIFFALYKTLFVTIEMYHAPFYGWITDLSAPDPAGILLLFGLINWDVPPVLSLLNIGVLPIVMGLTMYLQQKLNPAPVDPVQARIFTFLPIVFTFILAGFAAGLVLYWSVNNILSILQQWIIQRKIIKS